jgi:hypothetical protein
LLAKDGFDQAVIANSAGDKDMNDKRPDTTPRREPGSVSAAWLRVLDLGVPGYPPPPRPPLALRVFAGVAGSMP